MRDFAGIAARGRSVGLDPRTLAHPRKPRTPRAAIRLVQLPMLRAALLRGVPERPMLWAALLRGVPE